MNPLLEKFNTPYNTAPFSKIKNEHYKPAFEAAIKIAKNEVDEIVNNPNEPSFKNTIVGFFRTNNYLISSDGLMSCFFVVGGMGGGV